ncbi:alpha-ketoglutarate-dependent dioxygenase alkB homolog 4-like, partial [Stegodyphus dumicola]|uniref:alpha-ketoglutarate-dependent dioxygenase alkB homolog 4-like n=1 Tax=Stegodyphus dumicola TaxID=202533 RepID=UPI0015AC66DF
NIIGRECYNFTYNFTYRQQKYNRNCLLFAQEVAVYTYCRHCNLCWPDQKDGSPLYLGKITLVPDFLTEEEETKAVKEIDRIPWVPSQSGRKKQDFGPKVNFKKRKGKIGDFRGFPRFTEPLVGKLQNLKELSDFQPVELCHLDYSPDRGSAIDPHIDDSWIWGERLVTINLMSPTFLILTAALFHSCCCSVEVEKIMKDRFASNETNKCNHKHFPVLSSENTESEELCHNGWAATERFDCDDKDHKVEIARDICSFYRSEGIDLKINVRVPLPARSLLILAGCARHNWFHEIKRQDIKSRRLAMTFRELAEDFLGNENERDLGEELLATASVYFDFHQ